MASLVFAPPTKIKMAGYFDEQVQEKTALTKETHNKSTKKDIEMEEYINDKSQSKKVELQKTFTPFNSVTFVIGTIIGSGIFITATQTVRYSGSFGLALIFWVLGSLVAIAGGLSYIELATLIKSSGGDYAYLKEMYNFGQTKTSFVVFGNTVGFLFGWSYVILIRPASNAVQLLTFSEYFSRALAGGGVAPEGVITLLAIGGLIFVVLVNIFSVRLTAIVMNLTAIVKLLSLLFISMVGLWKLSQGDHLTNFTNAFEGTTTCVGELALAMFSVLWTYDGWNSIIYTVEETKNPDKSLPIGVLIGIPIVTVTYLLVNIGYFASLSKSELLSSQATALTMGHVTMGDAGLVLVCLCVSISTLGSTVVGLYGGSRVMFALARDGNLMEVFSGIHVSYRTPLESLLLQTLLSLLYVIIGNVDHIINGLSTVLWVFYGLGFTGLLILRVTKRREKRPFKVWTIVPIIMIIFSLFLVIVPVVLVANERIYSLVGLLLTLTGAPVYLLLVWDKWRPAAFTKISRKITIISNQLLSTACPTQDTTTTTES